MSLSDYTEIRNQETLLARYKAERERDALATELEEARDTIEGLVEENKGLMERIHLLGSTIKFLRATIAILKGS